MYVSIFPAGDVFWIYDSGPYEINPFLSLRAVASNLGLRAPQRVQRQFSLVLVQTQVFSMCWFTCWICEVINMEDKRSGVSYWKSQLADKSGWTFIKSCSSLIKSSTFDDRIPVTWTTFHDLQITFQKYMFYDVTTLWLRFS